MDPIVFEKVTLQEAKAVLDGSEKRAEPKDAWVSKRLPPNPEDLQLQDATLRWIASLPENVRPWELARQFPRVANKLAKIWGQQSVRERELEDLLIDKRGNRQGFPMQVAAEVMALKVHYATEPQENTLDWSRKLESRVR